MLIEMLVVDHGRLAFVGFLLEGRVFISDLRLRIIALNSFLQYLAESVRFLNLYL